MLNINRDHMIMHLLINALLYLKVFFLHGQRSQ